MDGGTDAGARHPAQALTDALETSSFSRLKQNVRFDAKSLGNLFDIVDRNIPDLSLDVRDEGAVQSGLKSQGLL